MDPLLQNKVSSLEPIDPKRTAMIGVHWQEDVAGTSATGGLADVFAKNIASSNIIPRTARLFNAARKAGALVVFVNVAFWPGHTGLIANNALFNTVKARSTKFLRGSPGVEVLKEMEPASTDIIVEHSRISGFHGSDLQSVLIGHGIETVAITGVATNVAVDHTTRDAAQLGYRTILIEDCCCSSDASYHEASLKSLFIIATNIVRAEEFIAALNGNGR
jgi:nicotinamidase-related amidase